MDISFEDGMQESMLPIFNMETDESGYVYLKSGEPAPTLNDNEPLHVDEIGGFIKHPRTGEPTLVRDNISDIIDYVKLKEETGELTQFLR